MPDSYGWLVDFTEYDTRLAAYAAIVDDADYSLLTWYNGNGRGRAEWTLPGGGVEYAETVEAAIVREVREETGYDVQLGAPLVTHSLTFPDEPRPPRPYKSVRIVYSASVSGGTLGTLEVGGTTDRAEWIPIRQVPKAMPRSDIVDVPIAALPRP